MPRVKARPEAGSARSSWTFLSNHSHVLISLWRDPSTRVRDLALGVGITERAVLQILADLEAANVITRRRDGRRNVYRINEKARLRHPVEAGRYVGELLDFAG
jgi:DNA-binding MarR family transcriptional regulator